LPKKKDYSSYSKEDLIKHIHALERRKKYGLVWDEERVKEKFEEDAEGKCPVLKEVLSKELKTDPNKPTHILIEGDNYHALSVLNYTHTKSVDVIYIDPPYNTGKQDFKYNDKWIDEEDGYRHSKWIDFINKRLRLCRNLLKDTGVIFVSIDDNELPHLTLLMRDIFGEKNFIANIIWKKRAGPPNDKTIGTTHEYIVMYAKVIEKVKLFRRERTKENLSRYKNPDNHPKGPWAPDNLMANVKGGRYVESLYFPILNSKTKEKHYPSSHGNWRFNKDTIEQLLKDKEIYFGADGKGRPKLKRFFCDVREGLSFSTNWDGLPFNNSATAEIKEIFGTVNIFDTPKPTGLITECLKLATSPNDSFIILDFFAGSGTTGHAVVDMNRDGGKRQFILCTNNENNICTDICYPRLKKIIIGYKNANGVRNKGLANNLKYYQSTFVDSEPTHRNKKILTDQSTEMLCLKENAFDEVLNRKAYKIYKNNSKFLAILFDEMHIEEFKKELRKLMLPIRVYAFSLEGDDFAEDFEDLENDITVCSIPEAILRVYRRIFRK
jgi:adenine-specific DNA-methyltransferase